MPQPGSISAPDNTLGALPDVGIASQWQRLASTDRRSPDFLPLFLSLTTETNRSSTTKLRGDDAKITLGALDEVGCQFAAVGE